MSKTDNTSTSYESGLQGSSAEVATFSNEHRSFLKSVQHALHVNPALIPLFILVLSVAGFGIILGDRFFSPFSLTLILQQVAIVGVVATAQTLVILTKGIDLSVGAIMVLSSVVMGQFTFRYGFPVELAILCGFAVGALCGLMNGILVAWSNCHPLSSLWGCGRSFLRRTSCIRAMRPFVPRTSRRPRHCCNFSAKASGLAERSHLWRYRHGGSRFRAQLRAQQYGLGPARLCRRR